MTNSDSSPVVAAGKSAAVRPERVVSIDALRGFVMFTMIFVNDLAGGGDIVPNWMVHFSDRHHGGSGVTFVDLVFPAFLFIVGMSIPFALGPRLDRGEPLGKILLHIVVRTLSLLFIGILMVHETPDSKAMGWSGELWGYLMFSSAIFAFCSIGSSTKRSLSIRNDPHLSPALSPPSEGAEREKKGRLDGSGKNRERIYHTITLVLRCAGLISLVWLAFAFRDKHGRGIITLSPFVIRTSWYGILGLIGWSYLVGSIVFLCFRGQRTAILGCVALLLSLYAADKTGLFDGFWLNRYLGIGEMLGAHPAITTAGLLLGTMLQAPEMATVRARVRFTLWFSAGAAAAAWLLTGLYGISKNDATPSWCLWACAITALLWLAFYYVCDVRPVGFIAKPLAMAGQNVLLAYLLSEMLPNFIKIGGWGEDSLGCVIVQTALWGVLLLLATTALNRLGFRLKL